LNGNETTTAFFATSDTTEFPVVIVNNDTIRKYSCTFDDCRPVPTEYLEKFNFLGESIDYGYRDIPTESEFSFSIIDNEQTSVGEIEKPKRPNNVKCNYQNLREKTLDVQIDTIESSDNYLFSWQCDKYDYFSIDLLANREENFGLEESQYTIEDSGFSMLRIEVTSNTGFNIYKKSIDSNFELKYGNGYVLSSNTANLNYVKINR
jgi:hypothetical protein